VSRFVVSAWGATCGVEATAPADSPDGTRGPATSHTGVGAALAPAVDPERAGVGGLRRCPTRARPWPSQGGEGPGGTDYGIFCVFR
jgi:hypothetical protein